MKIKRSVFYIDESKREEVKQYLNLNNIVWSGKGYFKWDWSTAVVTASIVIVTFILLITL